MADAVACMALATITKRIAAKLDALNLTTALLFSFGAQLLGDSVHMRRGPLCARSLGIVGDRCFPVLTLACDALSCLTLTMGTIFSRYEKSGMTVHLKPGKTSAHQAWPPWRVGLEGASPGAQELRTSCLPFDADCALAWSPSISISAA